MSPYWVTIEKLKALSTKKFFRRVWSTKDELRTWVLSMGKFKKSRRKSVKLRKLKLKKLLKKTKFKKITKKIKHSKLILKPKQIIIYPSVDPFENLRKYSPPRNYPPRGLFPEMLRMGIRELLLSGYIWIRWKEYSCPEHTLVMGRRPPPGYGIHHINGIKWDNSLPNLKIMHWTTHLKEHHKMNRKLI